MTGVLFQAEAVPLVSPEQAFELARADTDEVPATLSGPLGKPVCIERTFVWVSWRSLACVGLSRQADLRQQ